MMWVVHTNKGGGYNFPGSNSGVDLFALTVSFWSHFNLHFPRFETTPPAIFPSIPKQSKRALLTPLFGLLNTYLPISNTGMDPRTHFLPLQSHLLLLHPRPARPRNSPGTRMGTTAFRNCVRRLSCDGIDESGPERGGGGERGTVLGSCVRGAGGGADFCCEWGDSVVEDEESVGFEGE